jgi:hypothetical protein
LPSCHTYNNRSNSLQFVMLNIKYTLNYPAQETIPDMIHPKTIPIFLTRYHLVSVPSSLCRWAYRGGQKVLIIENNT